MFSFNLETMLALAGILLGITFGLVSGISREEKVKYVSISVFGSVIVAFTGISFYAYGYSLEVLLGFLIWSCIGFISSFILGLGYRRRRDKLHFATIPSLWGPSPSKIREIEGNAPEIKAKLWTGENPLLGDRIKISIRIHNVSDVILDDLYAILKVTDLDLKKKEKELLKDLPNLVPDEEREYMINQKIGRYDRYTVDLRVMRNRVLLEEFHWTMK